MTIRDDKMYGEFDQTRKFLRACMRGIVQGEINHQQAQDIAYLAQQQNYSIALEASLFPQDGRNVKSQDLLDAASDLVALEHDE